MTTILGLNLSHDRSAALVVDGTIVAAVEEERLDRIKHSEGFLVQGYFERLTKTIPIKAITYCLRHAGMSIDEVDAVVGNRPLGDGAVRRILRDLPLKHPDRVHELPAPSHHLAHAATTYYTSGFESAAILVVDQAGSRDGRGRVEKHSVFRGEGPRIERVAATTYPVDYTDLSLGLFYDFFTVKLGFITRYGTPDFGVFRCGGYPEAGKTMGLAPYGRPRPDWGDWLRVDGLDVGTSQNSLERIWEDLRSGEGRDYDPADPLRWQHPFAEDIARKVQDELERAMVHLAGETRRLVPSDNLCLAGGITLNSVANQAIRESGAFPDVYVPAPTGDSGNAIGVALWGHHNLFGGPASGRRLESAALGRPYAGGEVDAALAHAAALTEVRAASVDEVADLIAAGDVVAWVNGGSEMGPRALGHRSILADPRRAGMRDYLNGTVKHREPFRPYAPSVLEEHASEWFDFAGASPFMLFVPQVRPERRPSVPAITHVDGTARLQTVNAKAEPEYHAVISAFHARTGVPLVLNTSFNDNGQPIVETPCDAVTTFLRTEIDHLVIDGRLVSKRDRRRPANHPGLTSACRQEAA
jgi:carbamoyltransferase